MGTLFSKKKSILPKMSEKQKTKIKLNLPPLCTVPARPEYDTFKT